MKNSGSYHGKHQIACSDEGIIRYGHGDRVGSGRRGSLQRLCEIPVDIGVNIAVDPLAAPILRRDRDLNGSAFYHIARVCDAVDEDGVDRIP